MIDPQKQAAPVQLVDVDVPFGRLVRLWFKIAVAALPLLLAIGLVVLLLWGAAVLFMVYG